MGASSHQIPQHAKVQARIYPQAGQSRNKGRREVPIDNAPRGVEAPEFGISGATFWRWPLDAPGLRLTWTVRVNGVAGSTFHNAAGSDKGRCCLLAHG